MAKALSDYYPPNPTDLPPKLTAPSAGYRLQALVVLLSLGLFLLVYLALIAGSLYGAYTLFALVGSVPAGRGRGGDRGNGWAVVALIAGGLSCAGVALFLVKGFFKRSRFETGPRLEIAAEDQPLLFAFLRKLTQDTGAPFPHRVYLSPEVNAAVFYHESVLSLIVPGRKNLLIGLGLVNRLDLAEFKAVLAHEFGHFAQSSMALGRYVYTANRAIGDVVYGRDKLDDAVEALKHIDIRLSIFVWTFAAVLWVLRKGLALLFRTITFANTSLSRQMEFNADRVAVSVAGSDAIVHALARLDLASEALGRACGELATAAEHGLYSKDVYYHQTRAAEQIKRKKNDPTLGEVPPLPADPEEQTRVFDPEDTSVPRMWATHPSNHDREVSAKEFYVRSPADPRPAWVLFRNEAVVREAMTRQMYNAGDVKPKRGAEWKSPEEVQAFIDQETEAATYDPRYHGLYDDRYIKAGHVEDIFQDAPNYSHEELAGHAFLYDDELAERMAAHKKRHEELNRLVGLASGQVEVKGTHFTHRGKEYKPKEADKLAKRVGEEIDKDFEWMHDHDRRAFRLHAGMAHHLGAAVRDELAERYRFHFALQDLHLGLVKERAGVQAALGRIMGQRQVDPGQFRAVVRALDEAHQALRRSLARAKEIPLPPLPNVTAGDPLRPLLLTKSIVGGLDPDTSNLDGEWIGKFLGQLDEVAGKAAKLLAKSLGGILARHEGIAAEYLKGR